MVIKNGRISNQLPGAQKVIDSLKKAGPKGFIQNVNGQLSTYRNDTIIKNENYGNFLSGLKNLHFDSLNYGLYQFKNQRLEMVSKNGNDIKLKKEGLFFVPPPGYDVTRKYSKAKVLHMVDSVSCLQRSPDQIVYKSEP